MLITSKRASCQLLVLTLVSTVLMGCTPNTNLNVYTYQGKFTSGGGTQPKRMPINGAIVDGLWKSNDDSSPSGLNKNFSGTTANDAGFTAIDLVMPAEWQITWENNPNYCVDQGSITQMLSVPWVSNHDLQPSPSNSINAALQLDCDTNDPTHPNFDPSHVNPQFALDDALPPSISVSTLDQLPSGGTTSLNVYDTSLNHVATMNASSVAGNNMSATFPYPSGTSAPLASGAYITSITNQIGTNPVTVHGMEPFYVAHDDTSFPNAYGIAVGSPREDIVVQTWTRGSHNVCFPGPLDESTVGGTPLPLVTLLDEGLLAVGTSTHTLAVGTHPTVVIPFNDNPKSVTNQTAGCTTITSRLYSGAQSAFVVNTGSANVSIVNIGQYSYPSGTVSVGNQPVAAAINSAETMAYVANYEDGTISEVDLQNLVQTRTLAVMSNPTSITFDSSGNLWVGGQGAIAEVNLSSWSVAATYPVDGTVNGMSYDVAGNVLVHSLLQNGSASSPSNGTTMAAHVSYSTSNSVSYSTQSSLNPSTGAVVTTQLFGDAAAYSQSSIASLLAFPAQTAIAPPIYSSTTGDITATVNGTSFTVSIVDTGQILIQGNLPYPARGVALAPTELYFTIPDTNSLISLPIQLP